MCTCICFYFMYSVYIIETLTSPINDVSITLLDEFIEAIYSCFCDLFLKQKQQASNCLIKYMCTSANIIWGPMTGTDFVMSLEFFCLTVDKMEKKQIIY